MDKIYDMAVIELVRLLRIVKRQLILLRAVPMGRGKSKAAESHRSGGIRI